MGYFKVTGKNPFEAPVRMEPPLEQVEAQKAWADEYREMGDIAGVAAGALLLPVVWPFVLFSGCYRMDQCAQLQNGTCISNYADIPVTIDEPPPYDYDMSSHIREDLRTISEANPCLLDGLEGVFFSDVPSLGYYIGGEIFINPTEGITEYIKDAEDHGFQMSYRLYHEVGHHIFHYVLEEMCPELLEEFQEISWDGFDTIKEGMDQDEQGDAFLNGEAMDNVDEDFAVTFCYYAFLPGEFQRRIEEDCSQDSPLAQKYEFMKDLFLEREFSRPWDGMAVIPNPHN